ncbi:hypothetical protein [Hungatella hathewayi]|uniref:Protein-PII uridylyltransferase N-terminal domain-containing protein n=1 Tax=Hungatella hathewayi WAL-18680 TaxID=742737 RepID=G5IFT2_9FIRM|nr:hypothetical protein [Hungatella hathewayi]EHI59680.1 hypothetical protein HMPREF9473_02360 [ [Hungatella hathewayi WAL-18680]MBS4983076.1 hypothetical protein [Hungatella hathewayi]
MIYDYSDILICPKNAEADIRNVIDKILEKILFDFPNLDKAIAVLLGGGFGRGEGSVMQKRGTFVTTNDYDIVMICEDDVQKIKIKELEKNIAKNLHLNFFGIDIITLSYFRKIIDKKLVSQSFYDLLNGSKVLWINETKKDMNIIDCLKNHTIRMHDIHIHSAFDVLKTRMWCIIALYDLQENKFFDKQYFGSFERFYFQQVKLATAIVDAVLISDRLYDSPCFTRKLEIFKKSKFYQINECYIINNLIERKIYNKNIIELTIEDRNLLIKLYCNCVEYVISNHKLLYFVYALKNRVKKIYFKYFRKDKNCGWYLDDYRFLKNNNQKKLNELQRKMRGIYE